MLWFLVILRRGSFSCRRDAFSHKLYAIKCPSRSIRGSVLTEPVLEALSRAGFSITNQQPNPKTDGFTLSPEEVQRR